MIEISFPFRQLPLLSPRTASYVAALVREGESFDYSKWLQEIREKERRAHETLAAVTSDELGCRELGSRSNMSGQSSSETGRDRLWPLTSVFECPLLGR